MFPSVSTSRKRKAESELSTNPNTIKARKRNEKLGHNQTTAQINKAKAADQAAVTYQKSKLVKSQIYQQASPETQHDLVKQSEASVRLKR